jgi:hypothetical protein
MDDCDLGESLVFPEDVELSGVVLIAGRMFDTKPLGLVPNTVG